MRARIMLAPKAVTWIGSAFKNKTKISPLSSVQVAGFQEEDKKNLFDLGIIDPAGAFTPAAYTFFNGLAEVKSFAGFRAAGNFGNIDKVAYFKDDQTYWVDNTGDALIFSDIEDTGTMLTILNELTGISHLVNSALDIDLDPTAALIFASLLDLTRQAALTAYAEKGVMPKGFSVEDILKGFELEGTRWIGSYLRSMRLPGAFLNQETIPKALSALIDAGHIEENDQGYALIRDAYLLAVNLLTIENVFRIRTGQQSGETIQSGEAIVLQAGLHDVLMLDSDGKSIGFTSLSTNALHETLIQMMTEAPNFS